MTPAPRSLPRYRERPRRCPRAAGGGIGRRGAWKTVSVRRSAALPPRSGRPGRANFRPVSCRTSNQVVPVNVATATAGTPVSVNNGPDGLTITPDGRTVYVSQEWSNTVTPIDTPTATTKPPRSLRTSGGSVMEMP